MVWLAVLLPHRNRLPRPAQVGQAPRTTPVASTQAGPSQGTRGMPGPTNVGHKYQLAPSLLHGSDLLGPSQPSRHMLFRASKKLIAISLVPRRLLSEMPRTTPSARQSHRSPREAWIFAQHGLSSPKMPNSLAYEATGCQSQILRRIPKRQQPYTGLHQQTLHHGLPAWLLPGEGHLLAHAHGLELEIGHIPGIENTDADDLSRNRLEILSL